MKLKLVVASMSVLGLVSCPVFAAATTPDTTTTTVTEHKHHHKHHAHENHENGDDNGKEHHHHMHHAHHGYHHHEARHHEEEEHEVVEHHNYKGECHPAVVPVCAINESYIILEEMTQNVGRALPNPCHPGWFNRIALSGGINVDIGKWGNRNAGYMGENYQRISLNDAYVNVSAIVNDWAKGFASISYNTATINDPSFSFGLTHFAEYDAAYDNNVLSGSRHTLQLEQAFFTLGNFDVSPIFLQLGKQFQDFGRYEIHAITEPLTTVMSKTLATSIKLGFIASGFNGSVYVFDDPSPKIHQSTTTTNYGAALGYEQPLTCDSVGWDIGVGYLYNIIGVNDIAYKVEQFNLNNVASHDGYRKRIAGIAAYADVVTGQFYVGARYVQALSRFNAIDLPQHGIADLDLVDVLTQTTTLKFGATGARPWTGEVHAGVGFNAFCDRDQTIYIGYQLSRQAAGLEIPKNRYLIGYNIDVWKNTNFAIEWDHDNAYSRSSGGRGSNSNLVSLRGSVKFS